MTPKCIREGNCFYPERLVKDDVITGSVKLFYPDPENRFSLSTWQICFFILIQNAFLSGFLMRSKKFRSLDWKRIKKRIFTQWNPDKKDTLSCDWGKNQKTSFWRIRIKKRNWPCDDVIFHRLFRIKKLPPVFPIQFLVIISSFNFHFSTVDILTEEGQLS